MNLTIFNAETTPKSQFGRSSAPSISFSKGGGIAVGRSACGLIGLHEGDKVALGQDPDNPEDWYLFKSKDGFDLRTPSTGYGLMFQNSGLRRMVIESLGLPVDQGHRFLIAGQPTVIDKVKYFAILTISNQ